MTDKNFFQPETIGVMQFSRGWDQELKFFQHLLTLFSRVCSYLKVGSLVKPEFKQQIETERSLLGSDTRGKGSGRSDSHLTYKITLRRYRP
jgi:hypothetical protein